MMASRFSVCIAATGMEMIPPFNGGGIEAVTYEMAKELAKGGHKVTLLTTTDLIFSKPTIDGVDYVSCNLRELPLMLARLSKKVDIIHAVERANAFFGLFFRVKVPVIYHLHNQYPLISMDNEPLQKYILDRFVCELGLRLSSHVLSCKTKIKDFLVASGIDSRKITVLENAVDSNFFKPLHNRESVRKELGLGRDGVILFLGRIAPSKGLEEVIRALPLIEEKTELIVAGPIWDIIYFNKVLTLIKSLGLSENVKFVGNISYFDLPKYYGVSDVYICLAKAVSVPTTLLQAMAAELPIIVPNCSPYTQIVTPNNGYFVDTTTDPKLTAQAITLLLRDRKFAQRIAVEARNYIVNEFSWASYNEKLTCLYGQLIGR